MSNVFVVSGIIKKVQISEPKSAGKGASAIILVRYGVERESTGNQVDFVNAVLIRIPSFKFPKIRDDVKVGRHVDITGHLQGVVKNIMSEAFVTTELVADRVDFKDNTGTVTVQSDS